MALYPGPLRHEPIALELHNTRYAHAGALVDGIEDARGAHAWLVALGGRLPGGGVGDGPDADALRTLREPIRAALQAVIVGRSADRETLAELNEHSRRAPASRVARWHRDGTATLELDVGRASRADVVLSALAADAISLLTGHDSHELRACGAPGCVLAYLRSGSRREWCCSACGNRARQARHYARTRRA